MLVRDYVNSKAKSIETTWVHGPFGSGAYGDHFRPVFSSEIVHNFFAASHKGGFRAYESRVETCGLRRKGVKLQGVLLAFSTPKASRQSRRKYRLPVLGAQT